MARPKSLKTKEKMTLTVSGETKEMADFIRLKSGLSISEFLENCIEKEYKKLKKQEKKTAEV